MRYFPLSIAILCAFFAHTSRAQIFTNTGASVQTTTGAIVQMNGSMLNSSGTYNNTGTTTVTGSVTNNATIGDSGTINVAGDWINNLTFNRYVGTVVMNGGAQNFAGTAVTTFNNLIIQGGSNKTFNQAEIVDGLMTFTNGVCVTTQTNLLTYTVNGSWTGAAAASYVSGPAAKNFNSTTEFTYPIGKSGRVNMAGVTPTNATAVTYRAEYFYQPYVNITSMVSPLKVVSNIHYWNIDQTTGTTTAKVRLYWISGDYNIPSYLSDLTKLVVAMWNGSAWTDQGNSATATGSYVSGNIQSNTIATWGLLPNQHFTLGSDSVDNGLPVELDHFAAKQVGDHIELEWLTRSEIENLGFEIERSPLGQMPTLIQSWQTNPDIKGKSPYGADYQVVDTPPADGAYNYDLYQRDMNGERWHIGTETLLYKHVPENAAVTLAAYPNPVTDNNAQLRIGTQSAADNVTLEVYDITGRVIYQDHLGSLSAGYHNYALSTPSRLAAGMYKVVVNAGGVTASTTMVVAR
jgi:hypothetical protein